MKKEKFFTLKAEPLKPLDRLALAIISVAGYLAIRRGDSYKNRSKSPIGGIPLPCKKN